jgi:transposase-like protein
MDAAASMGVSASTVYKWRRRYRAEGFARLLDRSSRPNASANRTPDVLEAKVRAERFIQSALREWAYAKAYQNSGHRAQESPSGYTITIGTGPMPG